MVTFRRGALALAALVLLVAALAAQSVPAATGATASDVTIVSPDGTRLAATLSVPQGSPPPGGWPAIVLAHGLGGRRATMLPLAEEMGLTRDAVVLAYDARGHGDSGGLVGIDGPNEVADAKAVFAWLRDRADVADTRIGGFGISYGGGALWNSAVAGTPWATLEIALAWTDLRSALAPQDLAKSGVIAGFLGLLSPDRIDPTVLAARDAALAGRVSEIVPWAAARSSRPAIGGIRTPVFLMQGRRDFAFGLDQVLPIWSSLTGPKRLWIGLDGHAPSSFPAADTPAMLAEGAAWFRSHLGMAQGVGIVPLDPRPVALSPESWSGAPVRSAGIPATARSTFALPGTRAITASGKVQRTTKPLRRGLEVFGTPTVKVTATASGGWSRLVAVLSARTPAGKEIVVAGGGVPTRAGKRTYPIALSSQATFVPRGSRLTVTLASSSLAQSPSNLLYLDLPMTAGARVAVGGATLTVPALTKAVSR